MFVCCIGAVKWVSGVGLQAIECATESLVLYNALCGGGFVCSWDIQSSIAAILHFLFRFQHLTFSGIPRIANYFTDLAAKIFLHGSLLVNWFFYSFYNLYRFL